MDPRISARSFLSTDRSLKGLLVALDRYEAAEATSRLLHQQGQEAHQRPREARKAHHELVAAAVAEATEPDDLDAWLAVEEADANLARHQARCAGAQAGVKQAQRTFKRIVGDAWPVMLPALAKQRATELASTGLTEPSEWAYTAFRWPTLVGAAPGTERPLPLPQGRGDLPSTVQTSQVSRWWPIALHPNRDARAEHQQWTTWCWERLAMGHYEVVSPDSIAFTQPWQPTTRGRATGSRDELIAYVSPLVTVTHEGVVTREAARR